jgi:hypothetical protein
VRFGDQDDIQGLIATEPGSDRAIGYLCKYLTKSIAGTYDDGEVSPARAAHLDRLAEEVRWLPCAPTCAGRQALSTPNGIRTRVATLRVPTGPSAVTSSARRPR